jgi:hypothetical protein
MPHVELPEGYTTVHAKARFKEIFEYVGSRSGVTEVISAGTIVDPLQMDMTGPCLDPTSPDARWLDEVQSSGVCHDWVNIPGAVLEILDHWAA